MSYRILVRQQQSDLAALFLAAMEDHPFVLLTPSEDNLDWTDTSAITGYIREKSPNLVVNFTEQYRTASERDIDAASAIAQAAKDRALPVIQLSSFEALGPFYRDAGVGEELVEGAATSFARSEQAAVAAEKALVLRLPWVLDSVRGCLFDEINPALLAGNLKTVSDHHDLTLVHSSYVVQCLVAITQQIFCSAENWGVFNLRASDSCSEAELVDTIIRMINSEADLDIAMPNVSAGRESERLLAGSANFLGRRCTDDFGIQFPSWRHGFKSQIKRWLHKNDLVPDLRKIKRS
ncbi:sugar nucleotide-binding protein [Teredinibacter turnerae]|uniref:sugar nucleotide-binding protein n=1 Tax=Teredinibacter turnerae TaxID=2426 RepID=UPI0005F87B69|nr:sugar nucleotide-binding protein [Teredinibacter turnerae]